MARLKIFPAVSRNRFLTGPDPRILQGPRSKRDLVSSASQLPFQLGDLLDGSAQIGVGEKSECPAGGEHAAAHAVAFAPVGTVLQDPEAFFPPQVPRGRNGGPDRFIG